MSTLSTSEAKQLALIVCAFWSVGVFVIGWLAGEFHARERVINEIYQQQCREAGGKPVFNSRMWDCLNGKMESKQ